MEPGSGGSRLRMYYQWLTTQFDYLLFLRGVAFIALAVICRRLAARNEHRLPWCSLGLFGLLQCIYAWLGLLALSHGSSSLFHAVRLAVLVVSLFGLVEFGRNGLLRDDRPRFGKWLYPLLCGLASTGVFVGSLAAVDAFCRFAIGLPGGVLAAVVLWRTARGLGAETRRGLRLAACSLAMYELIVTITSLGGSFPQRASAMQEDSIAAAFGLVCQIAQVLCALGILLGAWLQEQRALPQTPQVPLRGCVLFPVLFATTLCAGWFVADWQGRGSDSRMRDRLLSQAREIAGAVEPQQAKTLSFTDADKETPAFQRIRQEMTARGYLAAVRGIYSLALRDGAIRFGPENYPEGDPQASPPGTPYEQPPQGIQDIFQTAKPFAEGPYTDEYGTFVSAFFPVTDPVTGQVLLIVGLDIEAADWNASVWRARLIPIIGTLLLLSCLATWRAVCGQRIRGKPSACGEEAIAAERCSGRLPAFRRLADMRGTGLLVAMGILVVAFLVVVLLQSWYWTRQQISSDAERQTKLAVEFANALRNYAGKKIRPEMEKRVGPDEFVPEAMSTSFITRSVFEAVRREYPDAVLRFPSSNPRNPLNQATPSEQTIIRYFQEHPEADSWAGTIQLIEGGETFYVRATPRRVEPSCLRCHGRPEDAPSTVRKRYGDTAGFGQNVGDVSLDLAGIPVGAAFAAAGGQVWPYMLWSVALCGAFIGGIGLLIRLDIQRRRRSEDALCESEERFRTISEQTGHLIYDWNVSTGRIIWTGRAQEIVGYSIEEMNSHGIKGWEERIHPEDRARTTTLLDAAMKNHEPFNCSYRFRKADGSYINVRDEGVFLYDNTERAIRMLGAVKDISEQKRAELELHNHMAEIERFNRIALGREHRIIELKRRVNDLSEMLGQPPPHPVPTVDDLEPHQQVEEQNFCVLPPREPGPLLEEEEFELSELFDLEQMQRLLDSFCGAIGIAAALIDLQGKVLIGSRWQRICTGFHRVNPQTLERCIESDTQLANQLRDGETFTLYQCRNGLTDAASPVRVGDRHVANVFVGQFLLEPADEQAFRRQAREYEFDENDYLRALREVPVVDRHKLPRILDFIVCFAKLAANMGLERLQEKQTQARLSKHLMELDRQRKAAVNLAEDAELARVVAERSEAALKTSEERFRTLIEQAADAVLLISPHGRILDANQEACRSLGFTRQELLTKSLADIDPSSSESPNIGNLIEELKPGQRASFESVHRRKDGSEYPVEVSIGVLELEGQRVSLGFSRDITERKLAEEKLRGAMERAKELELIINRSPATAWLWRVAPGWPVDYVSDSVAVFGYTPDDFTSGRVFFGDIIHPDDLSKVNAEVERHTKEGLTEFAQEYRIITKTGDIRWLSDWTRARKGPDGGISHYQGVTLDITERKQAEQEQLSHLRFLQSMDLIDKALRGTNDADQMLNDVLDVALSVFACDRAWLLHPCDPSAAFWRVPIERTNPQYPGACDEAAVLPMTPEAADMMQAALEIQGAVTFGPQAQHPLPPVIAARFRIQAQIAVLVRTKTGSPWMFGLHQCSHPRVWTTDEKRLLEEIGRRVSDSLTATLTLRDLRESEQRFRCLVEQASDCVMLFTPQGQILDANKRVCDSLGYTREELLLMSIGDVDPTSVTDKHREHIWDKLDPGKSTTFEGLFRRRDASTFPIEVSLGALELDGQKVLLAFSRDISQRKAMEEQLRAAAWTDRLTGLPNRSLFLDRLQQAVLRTARTKDYRFAVLFLDFDRFKIINDSLGHKVGDQLLQEAAERLRATIRAGDSLGRPAGQHTTARLGGDEFVVLLDGIKAAGDASLVADRLLKALSQPYHLGRHEVYSSVSIGIVTNDVAVASAEDVLRDADTAMYEAKLAGKGCYVVFDVSMRKRVQNRLSLEIDLRKAIDANQFFLMYQPIVSLETRQVDSLEVLIRWKHPLRGLVPPAEFIPIAEDTGLIVPIGEWVLREACRQFAQWRSTHRDAAPRRIAVNLSRSQLLLSDLPATIDRILQDAGLPPSSLHLEITESAVMRDVELVLKILHALKEIGVNLSMDDFGTGHSSLVCLHQFPFDVLKVDQSFIATINQGRDHAALVHAVISLARNLEISVVAEGIETPDQLLMLQALGCQFGQGFFLGQPMTADKVIGYRVPLADSPALSASKPESKPARKASTATRRH